MMKMNFTARALALLCSVMTARSALAETIYVTGNPKGREVTVTLDPSMAGKTIGVYAAAQSPQHQIVDLEVSGSGGEKISVETYVAVGKQSAEAAAADTTVPALIYQNGAGFKQISILKPGESSSSSAGSSSSTGDTGVQDPKCGCLTPNKIDEYLALYQRGFPGTTREQFCALLPQRESCENTGIPDSSEGSSSSSSVSSTLRTVTGSSFLSFNKCLPAGKHGVLVKIDLTNIEPAQLQGGVIKVSTSIRDFEGDKRATIKPKSDGRWSPQPLLLAGPTGGYFFNKTVNAIHMVNWKNKRKAKSRQLKVVAFLYYGTGPLLEVAMGSLLSGGKGTFEVVSGSEGYSFCAKFTKQRQYFNGYIKYG